MIGKLDKLNQLSHPKGARDRTLGLKMTFDVSIALPMILYFV